jgi:hypothetical protein
MSENSLSPNNSQAAYKPKTVVTRGDEIIELGEFYALEVNQYLFRGRVRPGQILTMRKGCLAAVGDIVQVTPSDSLSEIAEYQEGIECYAVCVGVTESLLHRRDKELPKQYNRVVYAVNNVKRYSPWFSTMARAFKAKDILVGKYGCEAGVYFSYDPANVSTIQNEQDYKF